MPKKETKKAGRPPLPKGKAKGFVLQVRFSESDKTKFERLASKKGLTLSAWVRQALKNVEQ